MIATGLIPETDSYDELKLAVLEVLPMLPRLVKEAFNRRLAELGVYDIAWRIERPAMVDPDKKPIVLFGGEGTWQGEDFNTFHKQIYTFGSEQTGCWLAGLSPGFMGNDTWVFNFTLAVRTLLSIHATDKPHRPVTAYPI